MQTGLSKGTYFVTVTHPASGCTAASGSLNAPNPINKSMVSTTDATCTGIANGKMSFNIIGGNPKGRTRSRLRRRTPTFRSPTAITIPQSSGNYVFTITDSKGCTKVDSIEIFAQKEYDLATVVTNVKCFGDNTGSITTTLSTSNETPPRQSLLRGR